MKNPLIEIKNLTFSYQKDTSIINNVSFTVEKGKFVSLLGHNGSGKSTLAKLLIGLLTPTSGEIYIDGLLLKKENIGKIRKKIALIFQNPDNQFIGATVEDDIAFGLENNQVPPSLMQEKINDIAKKVDMFAFLKKEPSNLSGGQKQRVAIAGGLVMEPEILILDEATSMLDPKGRREIKQLILKMRENNPNLTIISITHDIEEANLSDEVIVMDKGIIVLQGTPKEVLNDNRKLKELSLEVPFVFKLKEALKKEDLIKNEDDFESIDELVGVLCR